MSTTNVKYKRVGYLAACQSFGDDTDVVLLIPNLLKKVHLCMSPSNPSLAPKALPPNRSLPRRVLWVVCMIAWFPWLWPYVPCVQ